MPKVFTVFEKIKGKYREKTLRSFLIHMRILDKNCEIDGGKESQTIILVEAEKTEMKIMNSKSRKSQ